jgi:hypothetical protein
MAEPFFVEVQTPEGEAMLLNLDLSLAIVRQKKDATALIVSLTGARIETGTPFDSFTLDFLGPKP